MAMNGTAILVLIDTDLVASQRDMSIEETTNTIDVSSKDQREFRGLPGRYESTVSLSGLYVPTDLAYLAMQAAMRNGTLVTLVIMESGIVTESAQATIETLNRTAPDQDAALCDASFKLDGAWISGS